MTETRYYPPADVMLRPVLESLPAVERRVVQLWRTGKTKTIVSELEISVETANGIVQGFVHQAWLYYRDEFLRGAHLGRKRRLQYGDRESTPIEARNNFSSWYVCAGLSTGSYPSDNPKHQRFDVESKPAEQDVDLNTCPSASRKQHDNSTINPDVGIHPRSGVR